MQEKLIKDCTKPVGAYWLQTRLAGVTVRTSLTVRKVKEVGEKLSLTLSDGTIDQVDVAVLATGYKIDISKYGILDSDLQEKVQQTPDGYPVLTTGLETSVRGLHMVGVIAERTLGPTLRFVTGTSNAGPRVAASIINNKLR